nr:hypothetical protein [uncultured Oscillibacter sp.]
MSCSRLSMVEQLMEPEQFFAFEQYFESLSPNCKLSASKVAMATGIDFKLTQKVLQKLVAEKIFKLNYGLRCPVCGLLLDIQDDLPAIEKEQFCYQCEEAVEITPDDIEVIYTFYNYPFATGQQSKKELESSESVARSFDSLTQLIASGTLDLNKAFFSPTDQEYQELQSAYNNIFNIKDTTKEIGDSLESLTARLFSLCRHFRVASIKLRPNQIDCYVRNSLFIPGLSQVSCKDSFIIECKNEAKAPSSGYMNKLHSILRNTGKQFGIIVSKHSAPSTFVTLSNMIFLNDKIIIISLDANDIKSIIFQKANLLEYISRKIDEVKLNATKELTALGLYST